MTIQNDIMEDLSDASTIVDGKVKNSTRKDNLKVIIGELQREVEKELDDAKVAKILNKLFKGEVERLKLEDEKVTYAPGVYQNTFKGILESYLPEEVDDDTVKKWIKDNIDFSEFRNKMQAMKPIMANFAGRVNGNTVKTILEEESWLQ